MRVPRGKATTAVSNSDRAAKATAGLKPQIQNSASVGVGGEVWSGLDKSGLVWADTKFKNPKQLCDGLSADLAHKEMRELALLSLCWLFGQWTIRAFHSLNND